MKNILNELKIYVCKSDYGEGVLVAKNEKEALELISEKEKWKRPIWTKVEEINIQKSEVILSYDYSDFY